MDIRTEIKNFINENFMMGRDPGELNDSASLLELGIIDSTGVLELVNFIEATFEITIEDDELTPENLDTIDRMFDYISRKKQ